jgi:hypothetical protein
MTEIEIEQRAVCARYGSMVVPSPPDSKVGISSRQDWRRRAIVNGLRHPITANTTGWYLWLGDHLSSDEDFFRSLHVWHLPELAPSVVRYLSLAPGWRFLIDETNGYEDVWYDPQLLNV